jgi:3-phosphoshikimate 1-carboxyvinyltransferase
LRQLVKPPKRLEGTLNLPGDKSISHRALILNALARGDATLSGLSPGADLRATLRCLKALGLNTEEAEDPTQLIVHGTDGDLKESREVLDAANSGTTMRLLAGVLASQPFLSVLTGDASLRSRPMGRVVEPLKLMGAQVMGRHDDTLPPLAIKGGDLKGIEYRLPVASAQVKSCLILAGLRALGGTVIHQPSASRDHTERMLRSMGASIEEEGLSLRVGPSGLTAIDVDVPGDISAAAFWLVAAVCHPRARVRMRRVGVNPGRTGILEALKEMGARIWVKEQTIAGGEPVADIVAETSQLEGTELGGDLIPRVLDEVPILAVAACFARGETVIRDAEELRFKESDRIKTTVQELTRMGASIEERPDGIVIHGNGGTGGLKGAEVEGHGDHRLAMALGVAGLLAQGETQVEGAQVATVSYPGFWDHLQQLCDV